MNHLVVTDRQSPLGRLQSKKSGAADHRGRPLDVWIVKPTVHSKKTEVTASTSHFYLAWGAHEVGALRHTIKKKETAIIRAVEER